LKAIIAVWGTHHDRSIEMRRFAGEQQALAGVAPSSGWSRPF
jgi:hypothetical protein